MFSKKITVFIFLLVFFIPVIECVLNLSGKILPDSDNRENRKLAPKPDVDITNLDAFPEQYEKYYNDHFTYRNFLVKQNAYLRALWFNVSPLPEKVIIGNNGWLYNVNGELNTFRGADRFSDSALTVLLEEFKHRKQYLQQRNCSMYIFIIPTKYVVYPEYIGQYIKKVNDQTVGAQFANYVTTHSDIPTMYLGPALLNAKTGHNPQLFFSTDTHWTLYGGYVAYKAIITELRKKYSQLRIMNEDEIEARDTIDHGGNLSQMLNMGDHFKEYTHKLYIKKPQATIGNKHHYPPPPSFADTASFERQRDCDNNMPRVLVINDSFMTNMLPFFAEDFSHSTYIFDGWRFGRNIDIGNTEKPDIVVYLISEALIKDILNYKEY